MIDPVKRNATILALFLLGTPLPSWAFELIDEFIWTESGRFQAYPAPAPDGRTVRFSAFTGVMRDNNLFRLSDTVPVGTIGASQRSDTIYRYGAGVDVDMPVSRQRLLFNAQVEQRKFDNFGALDHTAYRLGGVWRWMIGNEWSGDIGYDRRKAIADFGDLQLRVKDLITTDHAYANAGYLLTPRWRVRGGAETWEYAHSESLRASLAHRLDSGTVGLDYVTPAANSIGGQFKYSEGSFPNQEVVAGTLVNNDFREYEASVVAHWVPTAKSTLDARLGYTRREHAQFSQRDFDGFTGRLAYDWFVTAKTVLNLAMWREIRSYEDVTSSYLLSHGISVGPSWAPTEKIVLHAKLLFERRDFEGDPGVPLGTGTVQREDKVKAISLSAGWSPRRNIELTIATEKGDRSSNVPGLDYDYTTVMGNARLRF